MVDPVAAGRRSPARLVVGVAIIEAGRVLVARRAYPPRHAGGWEFPGGKVEPVEDAAAAAVREVAEELGCRVEVTGWLPERPRIAVGFELCVCTARLVSGRPAPTEHDELRWLGPDELAEVAWLPADRGFLASVRARLEAAGPAGSGGGADLTPT